MSVPALVEIGAHNFRVKADVLSNTNVWNAILGPKMVANVMELLSRHPEQRAAVAADLDLVPDVIEEVLRFHNSTQYMHRTLTRDIVMHGEQMRAGDSVLMLIGAANHDDREYGPAAEEYFSVFSDRA